MELLRGQRSSFSDCRVCYTVGLLCMGNGGFTVLDRERLWWHSLKWRYKNSNYHYHPDHSQPNIISLEIPVASKVKQRHCQSLYLAKKEKWSVWSRLNTRLKVELSRPDHNRSPIRSILDQSIQWLIQWSIYRSIDPIAATSNNQPNLPTHRCIHTSFHSSIYPRPAKIA